MYSQTCVQGAALGLKKVFFCSKMHRCTVVENPGGVLGVLAKFFLGGYLGLSNNLGWSTFSAFFRVLLQFLDLTSLPPPPCVHLCKGGCHSQVVLKTLICNNFGKLVIIDR
jgi:hypothetical protein